MAVPIDLGLAQQKYGTNAPAAASIWQQAAVSKADVWERQAKSPEAERNYAAGVQFAVQNQLRLKGLQKVTAQDYAAGVSQSVNVYQQKTAASAGKWAARFAPYAEVINRIVPSLPAKVPGDPRTNVMNRVVPIAEALHQTKIRGAVTGVTPSPLGGGARGGARPIF